ncbi:hypothetical protein MLP_46590 [Microlunatus phosphovorus NM-1]|uniref:Uncharacterized protein n=1 Tax=Microlunatus phosphovorus (strain ATCC 700054 / DSM 10555 / JCM 9379 / NBRC 101784 / NCIMB 13414 / VKM Ac-1990 / NM-1) TaxID=1032480 RepID=F5XEC5_MICPN|nr:hypothetical protein [Microlunatus phosphovorus]BAK37673.1 hypothetical protein MLP_46590 [Microlunatus phosphovorus NM-1]
MAICFELVLNFGDNVEAAQAAARTDTKPWVLNAGGHRIPLHRPLLSTLGSNIELTILPVAVGWGVGLDGSLPRFPLTAAEFTELGHHLYDLLAQLDGYVTAKVGWDVEALLDPAELKAEWSQELADGSLDGLVISDSLRGELELSDNYVPFQPGYCWIPYRGEVPSSLTAD